MVTRAQVIELLESGHTYETAARELHVPPGRAYMLATGAAADSSAPLPAGAPPQVPAPASSQLLVNPPTFNPTQEPQVIEWVQARAARELGPQDP